MLAQVVATPFLELVKEGRSPVGFIHLVAVVEESMRIGDSRFCKSFFETVQIVFHSLTVEVVDNPPLATRSCSFHLLTGAPYFHAYHMLTIYQCVSEDSFTCRFLQWYQRTSKRPSRATVHIHLNAFFPSDILYIFQRLHPLRRQERQLVLLVAFYTIEGRDFHGTNAYAGIFAEVPQQVFVIDRRAEPPPACACFGLRQRGRPLRTLCVNEK